MSDFLQFDNFNFKLAIIQELMYEQKRALSHDLTFTVFVNLRNYL